MGRATHVVERECRQAEQRWCTRAGQTGPMLTEQNAHLLSDEDAAEFYGPMDRYDALREH